MKKLLHQNSLCLTKAEDICYYNQKDIEHLLQTDIPSSSRNTEMKLLEGNILLLQQKNKSMEEFYEDKIKQLEVVFSRQNKLKNQLMSEVTRLNNENEKQKHHIGIMKIKLTDNSSIPPHSKLNHPSSHPLPNNLRNINYKQSSSKGKHLFNSNNLHKSVSKLLLTKSRSENYFHNEYGSKDYYQQSQQAQQKSIHQKQKGIQFQ